MKHLVKSGIFAAVIVFAVSPFLFPTTVRIEVVALDSEEVMVSGWVEEQEDWAPSPFRARATPLEFEVRSRGVRAAFEVTPPAGQIRVQARARRGWFPGPKVEANGSSIRIEGGFDHLRVESR